MEELNTLLEKNTFVLFLAPPGWGKTQLLKSLYNINNRKILFVSPLRALAEEVYCSFEKLQNVIILRKKTEKEKFQSFLKKKSAMLVLTPEMFLESYFLELNNQDGTYLIVLDEFHLFYYWGFDFRPILMEVLMGLAGTGQAMLGLSATVANPKLVFEDFNLNYKNCYLFDLGNQKLLHPPARIFWFLSKKVLNRRFLFELERKRSGVFLFFCQYRDEVDRWLSLCKKKGIRALGCKGGEVVNFIEDLKNTEGLDCIFATTALSHGVNLPSILKVFIGYRVGNKDFWIQMTGRGGRRGESFELYHFDSFLGSKWNYLESLLLDITLISMINKLFYACKTRRPFNSQNSVSGKTPYHQTPFAKWKKDFSYFLRRAWKKRIP